MIPARFFGLPDGVIYRSRPTTDPKQANTLLAVLQVLYLGFTETDRVD